METKKIKTSAFIVQALATFSVAYLTTLIGYIFSWPSFTIATFTNTTTPLEAPMSSTHVDLLGSLPNFGALIATPLCGIVISRLGRRYAAMLFGVPFVLAWTTILLTKQIHMVLFSMFIAGFGAAGQVVSSVYISEIVQDSIRGGLATSTVTFYFIGVLVSYTFGWNLNYYQVVYINLALSILYIVMLMFLKESPVFLVKNGRDKEAAKSIAFYRRISSESDEVKLEIKKIKRLLDPQIDKILQNQENEETEKELLDGKEKKYEVVTEPVSSWKFLMNSPSSKRALFTCLILMAITNFSGALVLQVYAEPVLKEAIPSMSEKICALCLAIIFLISAFISAILTDKYGRRPITISSATATGVCSLLIGLQLHFNFAPPYFTAFIFFTYSFVFNIGLATTPFVLTAEAFLPEVKELCNSFVLGCMWLVNFILLYTFNPMVQSMGFGPTFYIFAIVCFIGGIFSYICLPETKGLPADKIQLLFYKKIKTVVFE